jgi:hypothetical protein
MWSAIVAAMLSMEDGQAEVSPVLNAVVVGLLAGGAR